MNKVAKDDNFSKINVAIICDWLTEVGGAEKVLEQVAEIFPDAPIFTSQYREKSAPEYFTSRDVRTGWLNIFSRKLRKFISPLRYIYFANLNLKKFDLVISINNAEAKNISRKKMKKNAKHISYLQGPPTQYYWGLYDRYLQNPGFGKLNFLARFGLKCLVKPLRKIDFRAAQKPDFLIANSQYVSNEIKKYYNRESEILAPSVDVENIKKIVKKITKNDLDEIKKTLFNNERFYLIAGRQVNWKRMDIAIDFAKKTGENLLLMGDGAEHENLVKIAETYSNIKFLPRYNGALELTKYLVAAGNLGGGFLFTSLEPFGITPVESLATGTPVIAFSQGGSRDFINAKNGVFFDEQNALSLENAVKVFAKKSFVKSEIIKSAEKFDNKEFAKNFKNIVKNKLRNDGKNE